MLEDDSLTLVLDTVLEVEVYTEDEVVKVVFVEVLLVLVEEV